MALGQLNRLRPPQQPSPRGCQLRALQPLRMSHHPTRFAATGHVTAPWSTSAQLARRKIRTILPTSAQAQEDGAVQADPHRGQLERPRPRPRATCQQVPPLPKPQRQRRQLRRRSIAKLTGLQLATSVLGYMVWRGKQWQPSHHRNVRLLLQRTHPAVWSSTSGPVPLANPPFADVSWQARPA